MSILLVAYDSLCSFVIFYEIIKLTNIKELQQDYWPGLIQANLLFLKATVQSLI